MTKNEQEVQTPAERKRSFDRADINRYLRDYRRAYSMQRSSSLTKRFSEEDVYHTSADEAVFRSKMFEIRSLILSIEQTPEKMLLYYYFVKGYTLDRCARVLGISRRSVYRLKLKALDLALQKYLSL